MPGLADTFALLGQTENLAATPVLLAALDAARPAVRAAAVRAVLQRRSPAGLREIVRRIDEADEEWVAAVAEYHGRLVPALREAVLSDDPRRTAEACRAAVRFREYELMPILVALLEDKNRADVELPAATLTQLADELVHELATTHDERRRRDPNLAREHSTAALEQSVQRYLHHGRIEPLEAFLQLAGRENAALCRILTDARDPAFVPLVQVLTTSQRAGVVRLLLSYLDDPRPPTAALQALFRRTDRRIVEATLKKIGHEPGAAVRANLRRIDSIAWLADETLWNDLDDSQQHAVVKLVQTSGLKPHEAFRALDHAARRGKPGGRKAAVDVLADTKGADANSLVLRALRDDEPTVRAAALSQLRARGIPGALTTLIEALDEPHEPVRTAAQKQLQEFSLRRFLPAFDLLEDSVRRATAVLVRKVDDRAAVLLREELGSSQNRRRARALEVAGAMELVDAVLDAVLACTRDDDQGVRVEAARVLGGSKSPEALEALNELLADAAFAVRESAQGRSSDRSAAATCRRRRVMGGNTANLMSIAAGSLAAIVAVWALTHYLLNRGPRPPVDNPQRLFRDLCRIQGLSAWETDILTRLADRRNLSTPNLLFVRDDYFDYADLGDDWAELRDVLGTLREKLFADMQASSPSEKLPTGASA